MEYLVYLTYPVLLAILLIGAKVFKIGEWNEEFMTLKQTKYIQGFFTICIMLHHIGQETCASWQTYPLLPGLEMFVGIGYFFVAFFMFCSGFGLYKSYKAKADYFKGFFRKRVLPIVLAFYTTGLIFFIARIVMKEPMDKWKLFCYISGWGLPNLYGWFAVAMPYFYLCFYLSFRLLKQEWMKIAGTIFGVFIYTFLGTWVDHNDYWMRGEWWYNCVHLFWIGILFARFEKTLVEKMKKHYVICLVLFVVGAYGFFKLSVVAQNVFSYYGEYNWMLPHTVVVKNRWICLSTEMLSSLFFVLSVLMLNMKVRISNKFLGFMGTITLEFYLIHGLFLEFFSYNFCEIVPSITRIENVALLIIVVFVPSVIVAVGLKKFHRMIVKLTVKNISS